MTTWLTLLILGCNKEAAEPGWRLKQLHKFELDLNVTELVRVDDGFLALGKDGRVVHWGFDRTFRGETSLEVFEQDACGLVSMALDPDFDDNGLVYFGACVSQTHSGIFRAHLDLDSLTFSDRQEILVAGDDQAGEAWHNIGWMGFDGDGSLFAFFGEKTVPMNAQNHGNPLGSVVRILPHRDPGSGGYDPHPDNPFVGTTSHEAIYSWGYRSPWTGAFDSHGGLWLGDVGSSAEGWEEVNYVLAGDNHGWGDFEGDCGGDCASTIPPVQAWPHSNDSVLFADDPDIKATVQRVGWVAPGHDGSAPDPYGGRLTDKLIYGDLCQGWTRLATATADGALEDDEFFLHISASAWMQGPDGHLYAAWLGGCGGANLSGRTRLFRIDYIEPE